MATDGSNSGHLCVDDVPPAFVTLANLRIVVGRFGDGKIHFIHLTRFLYTV